MRTTSKEPTMTTRTVRLSALTAAVAAVALVPTNVVAAGAVTAATRRLNFAATSSDWAGWDVTAGNYTSVSASWTVPTVSCSTTANAYSAMWVGLDGDGSSSVEQTGVSADCDNGAAQYSAWYEFYPSSAVTLDAAKYPVSAGDKITASVRYDASTEGYTLVLRDATQGWTDTTTGTADLGTNASAEVIAEAPTDANTNRVVPLADFGTVAFTDVTVNGAAVGSDSSAQAIDIADDSTQSILATTSALTTDGSAFTVTWKGTGSSAAVTTGTGAGPGGAGPGGDWPGASSSGSSGSGSASSGDGWTTGGWGSGSAGSWTGNWWTGGYGVWAW
jgi:hypothetical protein